MHSAVAPSLRPHRACGACGAAETTVCHHQRFVVPDSYPLPSEYDVVSCRRCGFVFADSSAAQNDYDRFYREWSKYDDAATSTGGGLSAYDAARLTTTATDIARALPSRQGRILDAGCATGGLLLALRKHGFASVFGLDPSSGSVAVCRRRGFDAYVGSITSKGLPRFDCVVLSHVLEHVYDIPEFFLAARRLLQPGGYLYLETPDATRYVDYLYAPFQEFNTEHINHFSAHSLETTAQHFGFTPVLVEQKLIQTSQDQYYPAVFAVLRDLGRVAEPSDPILDPTLPLRVAAYIRRSEVLMNQLGDSLDRQLRTTQPVIVWGAGQLAMKLLNLPVLRRTQIVAFVDGNPVLRGKMLAGAPIVAPAQITHRHEPIVISSLLHAREISAEIRRLQLPNPIVELRLDHATREGARP